MGAIGGGMAYGEGHIRGGLSTGSGVHALCGVESGAIMQSDLPPQAHQKNLTTHIPRSFASLTSWGGRQNILSRLSISNFK